MSEGKERGGGRNISQCCKVGIDVVSFVWDLKYKILNANILKIIKN